MEVVKEFDRKKYNDEYYQINKKKIVVCELCGSKYTIFNKYQHENTKKHKKQIVKKKQMTLDEITKMLIEKSTELNLKIEIKDNSLVIG